MKKAIINLYSFDELNDKAKDKAVTLHRNFLMNDMIPEDFITGNEEWDTPELLQEAYDKQFEYLQDDEPVIESILANEYLFYSDGSLARCVSYCGKHEKAGTTELTIGNDVYVVLDCVEKVLDSDKQLKIYFV